MAQTKVYPKAITPDAEIAFAHIEQPDSTGKYADGKYKATLLFDKDTDFTELKHLLLEAAKEEWGVTSLSGIDLPIKDGDRMVGEDGSPKEWAAGHWVAVVKSKFQPAQYDEKGDLMHDDSVRSGDRAQAEAQCFPYVSKGARGISLQLCALQRTLKGTRSASGGSSAFAGRNVDGGDFGAGVTADAEEEDVPF